MQEERARSAATPDALHAPFGDLDIEGLAPPMRKLVKALLLYKSVFAGPWFEALSSEENPEMRAIYDKIREETTDEARRAARLLHTWDATTGSELTEGVTDQVLKRLLDDMLSLKKSSTEVFLAAGLTAPTDAMRREFLKLADIDRRHADDLRAALEVHLPADRQGGDRVKKGYAGVHPGPFAPGTISSAMQRSLDDARAAGQEPTRIVMSSLLLRHLRDEGSVPPNQGDIFGLPVDIDFSWEGESFAITSRERVSLAEIVTEKEAGEGRARPGPKTPP